MAVNPKRSMTQARRPLWRLALLAPPLVLLAACSGPGTLRGAGFGATTGGASSAPAQGWHRVGGPSGVNARGRYGSQGKGAVTAFPGARDSAVAWHDAKGGLWLFGGEGIDVAGTMGELNDLWRYDPVGNHWRWMGGSRTANAAGVYGARGIPGSDNWPGARDSAAAWRDAEGGVWLFGGEGINAAGNPVELSDLWRYDAARRQWTWVGGSRDLDAKGVYGVRGVAAVANMPGARDSAATWGDGKQLWLFGGWGYDAAGNSGELNDLWRYDPARGTWVWLGGADTTGSRGVYGRRDRGGADAVPGARDSAAVWSDGKHLWLFGGWGYDAAWSIGYLNDLWRYDLATGRWTWLGGARAVNGRGVYGTRGVAAVADVPPARAGAVTWRDAAGDLWLFGGEGIDATGKRGRFNDLWRYDPASNRWSWMGGRRTMDARNLYGRSTRDAREFPGARANAAAWFGAGGDLWLFGGVASGSGGDAKTVRNDLWVLRP